VLEVSRDYGIDATLLHAVISTESGYNSLAVSRKGARGLMQVMPATAERYGVRPAELALATTNLRTGARYLADLLRLFDGDLTLALAAYNAGEQAVLRHGKRIPPYAETQAYVPRVLGTYDRLKRSP
jgi:soluble lytic murein transglycosylase-like protein